eukprot:EC813621.1.p4 GENE.EC813621.1~~EC813621.1.p4  ORF type:complete len:58 (+),score=4.90 EC813621.1:59-232(+)
MSTPAAEPESLLNSSAARTGQISRAREMCRMRASQMRRLALVDGDAMELLFVTRFER